MQTTVTLDRTTIAAGTDATVHVLLELNAPAAVAADRAPIDVVVVLDRSGSMSGVPIHAVREATCNLLRLLGPNDRLGVVAFDDEIETVLVLASHQVDVACARVRQIDSRGSTNLSGGWSKGFEMLVTAGRPDALKRVMVLTDGHANAGITDRDTICSALAGARARGITTSMIGFDDGYDEVLLAAMADAGAGNDYWCAGPDQAPQVFAAEFGALASVVAQNISVEIRPRPGAGVDVDVLNEYPTTRDAGGVQIALGDAFAGERRHVVVSLRGSGPIGLGRFGVGRLELGDVVIRWASTTGTIVLHAATLPIVVTAAIGRDAEQAPDQRVIDAVTVLRAARARKDAHERILHGDTAGAQRALRETLDLLAPLPAQAAAAAQARTDLDQLRGGQWDATSSKRLHAAARSAQKGRRTGFDDPA